MGGSGVRLEPYGPALVGWTPGRVSVSTVTPTLAQLPAVPLAWSAGTPGPVRGEVVLAPVATEEERALRWDLPRWRELQDRYMAAQRGKLRGKVVLVSSAPKLALPLEPTGSRYDEAKLAAEAGTPAPAAAEAMEGPLPRLPADPKARRALLGRLPLPVMFDFWRRYDEADARLERFFGEEGVVAVLSVDQRGDGGTIFAEMVGCWEAAAPAGPPRLVLMPEAYGRLARLVGHQVPVEVEVELQVTVDATPRDAVNVIGELPGGKRKDEVVMVGAHLDSWHAATGATDDASGCAVVLEAFRILKALDLPLDRTVRLALWDREEQDFLGSLGYVRAHFGDPTTMVLKPEHAKLSAYFNLDYGPGRIRGIYLQGNDMARPILEGWLAPFRDLGVTTVSNREAGSTDHKAFDAVGLPGFQFIQDPLDFWSRARHSTLDAAERVPEADLIQAAEVLAFVVYKAATAAEPMPRKPLPAPVPARLRGE
jgi:carboxypeptidase Q